MTLSSGQALSTCLLHVTRECARRRAHEYHRVSVRISSFMISARRRSPSSASFPSGLEEFTPPGNLTELYIPISEMMVTLLIVLAAVNVNMLQ